MKTLIKLFLFYLSMLTAVFAGAQTIDLRMIPDDSSNITFSYDRFLIPDLDLDLLSGNYDILFKHAINSKINVLGEINFGYIKGDERDAESGIGNLFLGIQYKTSKKVNTNSAVNIGIYLPTADEKAQNVAIVDFFNLSKFLHKITTIHIGYNSYKNLPDGLRFGFELGTDLGIPSGNEFADTELYGKYGVSLLYQTVPGIYLQSELLGFAIITEEGDFDENSFHKYLLGIGYKGNKFGIGIHYKNYFDDLFQDGLDGILGINANVVIK